jgi:hypothetical protein
MAPRKPESARIHRAWLVLRLAIRAAAEASRRGSPDLALDSSGNGPFEA